MSKNRLKRLCGYVEQASALIPEFTVEQMLLYTSELKLPASVSYEEKRRHVDALIAKLQLGCCRHAKIGDSLHRGISGGQEKRVSVGLALICQPSVLLLDEPTSGLDSRMATSLCELLTTLAEDGCTLIATVHSPSAPAFACFHDLMLLAKGKVAYTGEVQQAQAYFENLGCNVQPGVGFSLPDWLLDIVSDASDICDAWPRLEHDNPEKPDNPDKPARAFSASLSASLDSLASVGGEPARPTQLRAFRTMIRYRTTARYRDPQFLAARCMDKAVLGVVLLSLYWDVGSKEDMASVHSTVGIMFFLTLMCGFGATPLLPSLIQERAVFYRERADGLYTSLTYYAAKLVEEAVVSVPMILLFNLALHYALALRGSFWIFSAGLYVTNLIGIALAHAIAALSPTLEAANATLPAYLASAATVCGFFILCEEMAKPWQVYSATSFLKYTWTLLMLNHFRDHPAGEAPYYFHDGDFVTVLDFYGMDQGLMSSIPSCFAVLGGLWTFFALSGMLALAHVSHLRK